MTLGELREYIRVQLDMDEEELPNALLDSYLQEAFTRTISMENRWPFYETRWTVAKVADTPHIALPAGVDPAGIVSLIDASNGYRMIQIGSETAEDSFVGMSATADNPVYFSIYGNELVLWPDPPATLARSYQLRGYRLPNDWISQGASAVPDCDARLHQLLAHYAIALAYAQQEDEVLEDVYMRRWQASFVAVRNAVCQPRHHRPLIFNGGLVAKSYPTSVTWASPPVHP